MIVATALGPSGFAATVVGLLLAWAYSAPPLRLKRNGWWGTPPARFPMKAWPGLPARR